ncbi:BafA family autotransporter [Bartonella sp. CB169]|uniref:BafA family autotransporter n=1 Tax=Bartonella sp. CB169 TaxID=3112257 RepID=UPI00300E0B54
MCCKYKLSFSVLMVSGCLIQIANADETRSRSLERIMNGNIVPKGSVLIGAVPFLRNNITISDGGAEIVENGKSSVNATVNKGGWQIVTRGGIAISSKILAGLQFVFEEGSFVSHEGYDRHSSAYDAIVSGVDGVVGQQNVYDGGKAWNTKIMQDGEQNLYAGHKKEGGKAEKTGIFRNGRQYVLAGGKSHDTTLNDQAIQVVYPRGIVDTLTVNDSASSWIHVGAEKVLGEVKVNDKGLLYLFAGDAKGHVTKEKLSVTGRSEEILFFVGEQDKKGNPHIEIEGLSGNGGTVSFSSIPYDPRHISLHVERLSGNLHFNFNIDTMGGYNSDYLLIGNGSGNHTISVTDSGVEITAPILQKSGFVTALNLITDRSQSEGAHFTLTNNVGEKIEAVDGGTYMYRLHKRERNADSSGDFTIWYLGMSTENSKRSETLPQRINKRSKVMAFTALSSVDTGTRSKQRSSSSQKQGSPYRNAPGGKNKNNEQASKPRPPRHVREVQPVLVPSVASYLENQVINGSHPDDHHHPSEEKGNSAFFADAVSLADHTIMSPRYQDQFFQQMRQESQISDLVTTPSTDAVLSMSVTPGLIFDNELRTARAGRGFLDRSKKSAALWTYAIKSKESISADHIDFKLEQTGIVLGISRLSELKNGEFYIGGFGSYDQSRIAHARGGISGVTAYSIGAYATYFDHNGWYLDGILKYNRYQNNLKAVSTNGLDIEGNYHQWAVGTSLEAGYRVKVMQNSWLQPYAQLTWLQVEEKKIKLSNKMTGDISPFISLRNEFGLSLGYEFGSGIDTSFLTYITVAWLRENQDNNRATINDQYQFATDLSGNAGKIGVGLSALVRDKLKIYAEAHYVKGHKKKQSLQGILGVRYSF